MTNDTVSLKPCPLCNSEVIYIGEIIECEKCMLSVARRFGQTPNDFLALWNTRTAPAQDISDEAKAKAIYAAVSALYFDDGYDFKFALLHIAKTLVPELLDELEKNPKSAFDKARSLLSRKQTDWKEGE